MHLRIVLCPSLALATAACSVYDPALLDASVDEPPDCTPRRVPPPRPAGDDDGVEAGPFVWGLKDVTLNQDAERWREIGFDLDGRCTRLPSPDVECLPPNETVSPEPDGVGGLDNAIGHQLFPVLMVALTDVEAAVRASADAGFGVVVVQVEGWNGEPDDPRVDVRVHISVGATPVDPGATEPPADVMFTDGGFLDATGAPMPEPQWGDGDENWYWSRDDNFLMGDPDSPFIRDDAAYVAADTLVFTLPERSEIQFRGTNISVIIRTTDGVAAGPISADRTRIGPVTFAGRWSVLDILRTAETVGVCPDTTQHDILVNLLDRIADVRSLPESAGPGVPCDACSFGAHFQGYRGRFAGLGVAPPAGNACAKM